MAHVRTGTTKMYFHFWELASSSFDESMATNESELLKEVEALYESRIRENQRINAGSDWGNQHNLHSERIRFNIVDIEQEDGMFYISFTEEYWFTFDVKNSEPNAVKEAGRSYGEFRAHMSESFEGVNRQFDHPKFKGRLETTGLLDGTKWDELIAIKDFESGTYYMTGVACEGQKFKIDSEVESGGEDLLPREFYKLINF